METTDLAFESRLQRLLGWVEAHNHRGYDLYDGLTVTNAKPVLDSYVANTVLTQIFKKCPVNLRPLFGMPETKMPKAAGLFLNAYALLAAQARRAGDAQAEAHYLALCEDLTEWLLENVAPGYAGACWNFGFNYKFIFDQPTVVITAVVARGLFAYYRLTQDVSVLRVLRSIGDFILNDLDVAEMDEGLCFSYVPLSGRHTRVSAKLSGCFNASMFAAEVLGLVYGLTGETTLLLHAKRAVDFTVAHQHEDGRWSYSIDLETGETREQIDFHQGFVLESLLAFMQHTGATDPRYTEALAKGARFYRDRQFVDDGRARWRWPTTWPVDIHNQAQGIITFCKLAHLDDSFRAFAETVARWTIDNMQDQEGYFYYQKHRTFTNEIPYMRWGQAWMALALTHLTAERPEVGEVDRVARPNYHPTDALSP